MKKFVSAFIAFILLLCIAAGVFSFVGYRMLYVPSAEELTDASFQISGGESFRSVAMRLEARGFIRSALALQLYARVFGDDTGIQKGTYVIPAGLSAVEIATYLSSGHQNLIRITIPEGKTMRQVAAYFDASGIISGEDFLVAAQNSDIAAEYGIPYPSLEGYMFPETYLFAEGVPAERVVRVMVDQFFIELSRIYPDYLAMSPNELHEKVTMASIVEREYMAEDEAAKMASVFYNRLELGMMLESCATVIYVMTEEEGLPHPTRLFFRDLERESAFNTYTTHGLPPAPISGLGRIALNAAFYPEDTDYLFFVLESPNAPRHVFSTSYSEHLDASQVYYFKLN